MIGSAPRQHTAAPVLHTRGMCDSVHPIPYHVWCLCVSLVARIGLVRGRRRGAAALCRVVLPRCQCCAPKGRRRNTLPSSSDTVAMCGIRMRPYDANNVHGYGWEWGATLCSTQPSTTPSVRRGCIQNTVYNVRYPPSATVLHSISMLDKPG